MLAKNSKRVCIGASLFLFAAAVLVEAAPPKNEGFKPLFNGKNFDGWVTKGNWKVTKDGVLTLKPRPGEKGWQRYGSYLWTDKKYGDFVLDLEFKIPPKGNSGIFVRTKSRKNPVETGMEVQILDSYGKKGKLTHHDNGGLIRTTGPSKNMSKKPGEWNRLKIRCKGSDMTVNLNDEEIIDIDLAKSAMKDRPPVGYIGLQDHGQPVWFRNIQIKKLD